MYEKFIFRSVIYIIFLSFIIYFSKLINNVYKNITQINIIVDDKKCHPMKLVINNEKIQFLIKNNSKRKIEWEILKDVMIVEERENIAPGFIQKITIKLQPGEYDMTCGLLSNPKGKIIVKNSIKNDFKNIQKLTYLDDPINQYKKYVINEMKNLVIDTKKFTDAIKANNINRAKKLFAPTRQHYERIESITELFSDLDAKIDAREDDYEKKSLDPNFRGFHKLEKAIFFHQSTIGMNKYADFLYKDILELQNRINKMIFLPEKVIGGAAVLIEEIATNKISGEENIYSRTDLWDFSANIEGAKKIVNFLRKIILEKNPKLLFKIDNNFNKIDIILNKYKINNVYESYEKLSISDKILLKGPIETLAEDLALLRGILEIE